MPKLLRQLHVYACIYISTKFVVMVYRESKYAYNIMYIL